MAESAPVDVKQNLPSSALTIKVADRSSIEPGVLYYPKKQSNYEEGDLVRLSFRPRPCASEFDFKEF